MTRKATHADADLILKLYEARREAEIRKARHWWTTTFWPQSADDVLKIQRAIDTQENAWFRQVIGYWNLASSFVKHGVLSEDLFFEGSFCGEMFFVYAKLEPFLKEIREKLKNPTFLANLEAMARSRAGRERYKQVSRNVDLVRKARAEKLAKAG
jgi:hypothetical protein